MNIKLIPKRGSGFVICHGYRHVTDNNPAGQFVVAITDATDDNWSRLRAKAIIRDANGSTSKYFLNGDRLKFRKNAGEKAA